MDNKRERDEMMGKEREEGGGPERTEKWGKVEDQQESGRME